MPKADDEAAPGHHWFESIARHTGEAYLRYSFTKGTVNEVDFLVDVLALAPGARLLDVGCGPGRHSHELAARGFDVVGVDISQDFIDIAMAATNAKALGRVTFVRGDARQLPDVGSFDAVISLCQGGFGLPAGPTANLMEEDTGILTEMAARLKPQGHLAVSAFSAYFQMRWLEDDDSFDAVRGVNHERTVVKDADGLGDEFDLWTRCYTPTELRLLAERAGLEVTELWSVAPGAYGPYPPVIDQPEFLMVARRPNSGH